MSNPMLKQFVSENVISDSKPMTVHGTINKIFLFLAIMMIGAGASWTTLAQGYTDRAEMVMGFSLIAGLILAVVTAFKPQIAKITGIFYAMFEGLLLGGASFYFESLYNGIVSQAIGITIITLFTMLFLYTTKIIRATDKFKRVVATATLGIAIYYLICIFAGLFGHPITVFNGGLVGIGISLFICVIAALNFITDFDIIEQGSKGMLPDYYEWYGAFTLLVTLVWFYFEILKLLAQLNKR